MTLLDLDTGIKEEGRKCAVHGKQKGEIKMKMLLIKEKCVLGGASVDNYYN